MSEPAQSPEHGSWSSALSTNDFAACVESGLQPLGYVQGCSVVSWNFYGYGARQRGVSGYSQPSGYYEQFQCPHGFVSAEHPLYGVNYEQTWLEEAWTTAFSGAFTRLVDEARRLGAHGVVGVVDRAAHHPESTAYEFSLSGTAVGVEGIAPPSTPFTTFLAGQKLNKLVEAGFAPVSIALCLVSIGVYASCVTEYQLRGGSWAWGGVPTGEIDQLSRAHAAARGVARDRLRRQLAGDSLHAAHLSAASGESGVEVTIRGNRVRRFKDFETIPPPRPVVRLVDQ